jgi:phosphoribosylformimino-5-aminoimidazole carboxamide ribotide isomerase
MKIEIIPAIDIIDGKCVRLSQGDYGQKTVYHEDPLEVALMFEAAGVRRLHLVDLDGAKANHIVNQDVLAKIASKTKLVIDFGGGLKTEEDVKIAFNSGASMITGGSVVVRSPEIFLSWIEKYGNDRIILGVDAKDEKIAVSGWTEKTGIDIYTFIRDWQIKGIQKIISTDISRDGMLAGPSIQLYKNVIQSVPGIYLIASGGVSSMKDILALQEAQIPAVIIGKAIYEGRIQMKELEQFVLEQ